MKGLRGALQEKGLAVPLEEKLTLSQQHTLTAQRANPVLGCMQRSSQHVQGGDPDPLCSCDTPAGSLHPALGSPAEQTPGSAGVGSV